MHGLLCGVCARFVKWRQFSLQDCLHHCRAMFRHHQVVGGKTDETNEWRSRWQLHKPCNCILQTSDFWWGLLFPKCCHASLLVVLIFRSVRCDSCSWVFVLFLSNMRTCPHGASEWQHCQAHTPSAPIWAEHAETRTTETFGKSKTTQLVYLKRREPMHVMLRVAYYTCSMLLLLFL